MRPSAETLSNLLLALYATPARPERWHVFLREFSQLLDAKDAARLQAARDTYRFDDLARAADLESTDFYRDFLRQTDSQMVVPHLRNAVVLRHRLRAAEESSSHSMGILDSLTTGVVLLNDRCEGVFVSRKAETLCAVNDGLYLKQSRLGAHRPDDQQTLQRLLDRALEMSSKGSTQPCGIALIQRSVGPPLTLSVVSLSPLPTAVVGAGTAVAAVFIRLPDEGWSCLPDILTTSYGLTGAEARLCTQLFGGHSLAESAARNQVSRETVRAQLRSVFSKTHVRRQSDLLQLCHALIRVL